MNIQTFIKTIQTDTTNGSGRMPPGIMDAVTGLVSRLEGMLPSIEIARRVAVAVGITWTQEPGDTVTAWARTVWPLYYAGRIGDLLPVVLPLLPAGQPYGQSEIDTVRGEMLVAEVEGDEPGRKKAKRKAARMIAHDRGMN